MVYIEVRYKVEGYCDVDLGMWVLVLVLGQEGRVNQVTEHFLEVAYDDVQKGVELLHMVVALLSWLEIAVIIMILA